MFSHVLMTTSPLDLVLLLQRRGGRATARTGGGPPGVGVMGGAAAIAGLAEDVGWGRVVTADERSGLILVWLRRWAAGSMGYNHLAYSP